MLIASTYFLACKTFKGRGLSRNTIYFPGKYQLLKLKYLMKCLQNFRIFYEVEISLKTGPFDIKSIFEYLPTSVILTRNPTFVSNFDPKRVLSRK